MLVNTVYLERNVKCKMQTMEPISQPQTESESESESESEPEDMPEMEEYLTAKSKLLELNKERKSLMESMKRKADEVEDFLRTTDRKKMRIGGVQCEIKSSKHVPWNEKSIREHMDEDGKLDVAIFKSQMTTIKERLVMKCIN